MIGEDRCIRFGGCQNEGSCSIILRGSSDQILDEAERSLNDTLCTLIKSIRNPKYIWGGGFTEMKINLSIENLAKKFECKKSLPISAFGNAIKRIPEIIVENAGLESVFLINKFKKYLQEGREVCINIEDENCICNAKKSGLIENSRLKIQIILFAVEAVEMIIRIDKMFLNC